MTWYRLVLLLFLSLGLGGCWERWTRPHPSPTAPYAQDEHTTSGRDLPTPHFFQIERAIGPSE